MEETSQQQILDGFTDGHTGGFIEMFLVGFLIWDKQLNMILFITIRIMCGI